ncbi:MAG: zinc ribbon domain-containing protein [Clostridia bacterium]|nr:zinc ribbon domain-containing protein [Clostridia bacterium]
MSYCRNCGSAIGEQDRFCPTCGVEAPVAVPVQDVPCTDPVADQTQQALTLMQRMFKYERLAWKIGGIIYTVLGAFWGIYVLLFGVLGVAAMFDEPGMGGVLFVYAWLFVIYVLLFVSVGVFNLMMVKRAHRYMTEMTNNLRPALVRAGAVGMIVLSALFNNIAMIFIIINFVNARSNRVVLEQVAAKQEKA